MAQTTIAYQDTTSGRPQQVDAAHPLPVLASVVATATTVATATAAAPTYSEGQDDAPLSVDLAGGLRITGTINATSATHNTAAAPSYSEGTDNAFSANLAGDLRVIAKQSGTWVIGAGSNLIGSTSIDQTTPGTTNAVDATNFPDTVDVNSGSKSNNTLRVVLATDQPALTNKLLVTPDLPSGASTAAKQPALGTAGTASADVITVQGIASMTALKVDGSAVTQPVSGTFWQATQPISAASLPSHDVTNAGTFAVQPAGSVAHDATGTGVNPVLEGGYASAAAPTDVSADGDSVRAWNLRNGARATVITAAGALVGGDATNGLDVDVTRLPALVAGTAFIGYVGHGKTIKTATVNITADTDIVAAVTSKRIKVIAYALFKTGTNSNPIIFKSNGTAGTELARVLLQSQASAVFGANLAIPAPSFLFATVAGEKLTMDVGDTDVITGFITYFDDDAT